VAVGVGDQVAIGGAQLIDDHADVVRDRRPAEAEHGGDLGLALAFGPQLPRFAATMCLALNLEGRLDFGQRVRAVSNVGCRGVEVRIA
jgi:hypothetical protein